MATTTETRPDLTVRPGIEPGKGQPLKLAVVVLGIAVVVLGALALFGGSASHRTVSAEVEQLLDSYVAAWNDSDNEAFRSVVSDDYVIETARYGSFSYASIGLVQGWHSEPIGEPVMVGDGPWYVANGSLITADGFPSEGIPTISTFKVVDEGGVLKIAAHYPFAEYYEEQ